MIATERAMAILNLAPTRDGFEVYRVGRIFTVDLWPQFAVCEVCRQPIRRGERARDFYTRTVGTSWQDKKAHFVHEPCWLQADTAAGRQAATERMARLKVERELQGVQP